MTHLLDINPRPLRRGSLRIGMLHYHLKSGGVVSVMRDIAQSIVRYGRLRPIHIDVFAATDQLDNAGALFDFGAGKSVTFKIINIPSLAYRAEPYADRASFLAAADRLAQDILHNIEPEQLSRDAPYILQAHNISLGKNPTATMAFQRIAQIAAERKYSLWLINQVHDFAENNRPDQLKVFFTCTGRYDPDFARTFMYPSGRNIFYLTINSFDIENLLMLGIDSERIFLLPDPVDTEAFERKPIWEEEEWKREGLPRADYKGALLQALTDFAHSTSQTFDASLPILLSPMKVMRRKNNLEALLLLTLSHRLGRRFQLLISLDANSPPDVKYSNRLKHLAASLSLPVLVGFGHRLVSSGKRRVIRNGRVGMFSLIDIVALSQAVLTTSIMEGFGLVYHEGWLCRRPVIGRKISEIVRDFEQNGMNFNHLYDKLSLPLTIVANLRKRIYEEFERQYRQERFRISSINDIINVKIHCSAGEEYIDFADLSMGMQSDVIAGCAGSPNLSDRLIEENPSIQAMIKLLDDYPEQVIERNRNIVRTHYSLGAMARRLEHLFEIGDAKYRETSSPVTPRAELHDAVIEKYQQADKIRLLLLSEQANGMKGGCR